MTADIRQESRIFYDTEFIERGPDYPLTLISIGLVNDKGETYYAVSSEFREEDCNDWVKANVLPYLGGSPRKTRAEIANDIVQFVYPDKPRWYGYYSAYDHVLLCQLFGTMIQLPKGWPMYTRDLKQMLDEIGNPRVPKDLNGGILHNALEDALWNKRVYEWVSRNHKARMEALFNDIGLSYKEGNSYYKRGETKGMDENRVALQLDEGEGYYGFYADFGFERATGQFVSHSVWE